MAAKRKSKSTKRRGLRGVDYVANLSSPGHLEQVTLAKCNGYTVATLTRFGRTVARFAPGPAQLRKIRAKRGTINVTAKRRQVARLLCSSAGW